MVMKDYFKKVFFPPDIIISVSSCEGKIYPIYKDTFISGYRLQLILTWVTHSNTLSGFDKVPALTGLVILSRDGKQILLLLNCALVAGCEAHKDTLDGLRAKRYGPSRRLAKRPDLSRSLALNLLMLSGTTSLLLQPFICLL